MSVNQIVMTANKSVKTQWDIMNASAMKDIHQILVNIIFV